MEISHYQSFCRATDRGLKWQAKQAIRAFIDSFTGLEDKRAWVWANIDAIPTAQGNGAMRHELYEEVVFPVLAEGAESGDLDSILWLARLVQNFIQDRTRGQRFGSTRDLWMRAYAAAPSDPRVRAGLLAHLLDGFEVTFHEWPSGILFMPEDKRAGVAELRRELALARSLDGADAATRELASWEAIVDAYEERHGLAPPTHS